MSQENVDSVRRVSDSVARRDHASAVALHDPNVEESVARVDWFVARQEALEAAGLSE
jgi:hypothetical protein